MSSKKSRIELRGALWMAVGDKNLGGPGRIALLARIAECGSITQAAKKIKMSYKAAWDAIDTMNTLAGEPLVERAAGGKGGGGTRLTQRGEQLVNNFRLIEREHRRFVDELSLQSAQIADDLLLIKRMSMRTSARNQFYGKVADIASGTVNDEIQLEMPGGYRIVAIITRDSTAKLGLQIGMEAFALIKASSIIVATRDEAARYSARNRLVGTVSRLTTGAINDEVAIELQGGGTIVAIVTRESSALLQLSVGAPAAALFKASSVILGIPA
ncbi:ModE family transcriptional regulator [Steroidobacter denitrificans]|uniref:ModE family transcriptional regulator n=1 Tax=Steroidobacter denitrificans TaxID=465721 RepID=A0A127FAZ8_STEDE|nr:TOBE domain-containing protein [Steroidobacter denitrificans]AMN47593.1 ModE family transcriptional regulator [Steroidobacter denitrificans]